MDFETLLTVVTDEPVFETSILLAGDVDPVDVRRQLSRWSASGRLLQLRRGLYCLAPPYRKVRPEPFVVANRLVPASYVSLESALEYHGLIPENVPAVTSATTDRGGRRETPLGVYLYRHIQTAWLRDYRREQLSAGQSALVAVPEKALLDLAYLTPSADQPSFLRELRLQNLELLDLSVLHGLAESSGRPKLLRASETIARLAAEQSESYRRL